MKWDRNTPMFELVRKEAGAIDRSYEYSSGIESRINKLIETTAFLTYILSQLLQERDAKLTEQSNES